MRKELKPGADYELVCSMGVLLHDGEDGIPHTLVKGDIIRLIKRYPDGLLTFSSRYGSFSEPETGLAGFLEEI